MTSKFRYRYVFTVKRRYEEKLPLTQIIEEFGAILDEKGEYLYGGCGVGEEKLDVRLEVWDKPNKRWMPVNTHKQEKKDT